MPDIRSLEERGYDSDYVLSTFVEAKEAEADKTAHVPDKLQRAV